MIFVDTSAWFAYAVPNDSNHSRARKWDEVNELPFVTTDYVIDELLTLMKARDEYQRSISLGQQLFEGDLARIEWVTKHDVHQALIIFSRFRDKGWSFTDCTSRVVMERLGIATAFAFDDHFRQFGNVAVAP